MVKSVFINLPGRSWFELNHQKVIFQINDLGK